MSNIETIQSLCAPSAGDVVIALCDVDAVVSATGKRFVEEDEVHLWHFGADGLVTRFRHRADTHLQWLAFHGREV